MKQRAPYGDQNSGVVSSLVRMWGKLMSTHVNALNFDFDFDTSTETRNTRATPNRLAFANAL